jgi:hypothetical protein
LKRNAAALKSRGIPLSRLLSSTNAAAPNVELSLSHFGRAPVLFSHCSDKTAAAARRGWPLKRFFRDGGVTLRGGVGLRRSVLPSPQFAIGRCNARHADSNRFRCQPQSNLLAGIR